MKHSLKRSIYSPTNRTVLFTIASVTISVFLIRMVFDQTFWNDFLANLFATFLGIIVGIPIAMILSQFQERESERERKNKILRLIWQELLVNQVQLAGWRKSNEQEIEALTLHALLKVELWRAFSDGGEIEWIKDPVLLDKISEAYFAIKSVQTLSERHFDVSISRTGPISAWVSEGLYPLLEKGVAYTEEVLAEAFDAIGKEVDIGSPT